MENVIMMMPTLTMRMLIIEIVMLVMVLFCHRTTKIYSFLSLTPEDICVSDPGLLHG